MAKHLPPFDRVRHFPAYRTGTREELSRRLNLLYFGSPCCCGENVHPDLGIRDLGRHIYHALRCRVGLCVWRSKV